MNAGIEEFDLKGVVFDSTSGLTLLPDEHGAIHLLSVRHYSPTFYNKSRFVINAVGLADQSEAFVLLDGVVEDGVANIFCGQSLAVADYFFDFKAALLVATVVDTIGVQEKNISRAHQGYFGDVRRADLPFSGGQG